MVGKGRRRDGKGRAGKWKGKGRGIATGKGQISTYLAA